MKIKDSDFDTGGDGDVEVNGEEGDEASSAEIEVCHWGETVKDFFFFALFPSRVR